MNLDCVSIIKAENVNHEYAPCNSNRPTKTRDRAGVRRPSQSQTGPAQVAAYP